MSHASAGALALLGRLAPTWGERPSLLTPCGAAAEWTLVAGGAPRLTVEPARPDATPDEKWQVITRETGLVPQHLGRWASLAQAAGQRYGVWLGLRSAGDHHRYKVYQEIPAAHAADYPDWTPQLVAGDHSGALELYGRVHRPCARTLHRLLLQADAASALPALLDHLGLFSLLSSQQFAALRLGISYRLHHGQWHSPTFFLHSAQFYRSNHAALAAAVRLAGSLGHTWPQLARLAVRLAPDPVLRTGMLGLAVATDGRLHPSLGIACLYRQNRLRHRGKT